MQRKALVIYEPIGWLAADELELLKKLKIESSLYHNKDVHYSESKQQKWIGKLEDKLPEGRGIFIVTDTRRVVIVCEARGGQKDGQAKVYSEDGSYYTVQFRRDDCDGTADYFSANGQKILTANFAHDKLVELRYAKSGEVYIGEHFYLVRHGRGKQFKNDNQTMDSIVYNGIFENDKFIRGYARLDYYVGDLEDGVYEGQGTLYYDVDHSRKLMSGTFRNGKLDGYGQEFYENEENDLKYEGQFVDGIYEGDGSLVVLEPEKKIYQGKFKNGEPTMKFDILDEKKRVFQKVTYKNGKIIEIREEFFYNVKMASTKEIQDEEINSGNIDMQVMEKVCYARQLSSVRFYRYMKDENPAYIMQVDPKLFNIKYEGIINESGSLIYSGDMKHILFEGKGILRYAIKNEPRKYFGSFANGLFDGQGELYLSNNQLLYVGSFKKNSFHGMGKLTIHSIHLTGNTEPSPKELKVGHFPPERFDVEVDGEFAGGKFVSGIWRYTGLSDRVHDKLLTMKVENRTDPLFGKMYDKKTLLYEGTFAHYCFHGKGTLYYKDGVQKKYVGGFKLGCFEEFGQLYDLKGKLIYEGGFTNGIYDGNGKLYQGLEEDLIYEGELKKGKLTGRGKMLEKDGKRLRSEGLYENGVLVEGFVKIYSQHEPGKLVYEGNVKDGAYSGKGVLYNSSGEQSIQGVFGKGELLEGVKKEYHNDGSLKREGSVQNGQFEGHVKEYYYDGKIMFEGQYERGERNGKGVMYHRNGQQKQTGIFKDHVFYEGDAFYYFEDNVTKMFVGKIKNMYYNGPGVRYYENGFLEYEGNFKNGLYDGEGVYYYFEEPGKIKFKGRFGDGRPDGEGEYYGLNGQLIYKGKMINWKKEGKGVMYSNTGEKLLEGTFDDDRLYNGHGKILWPGFGTVKYEGDFQGGYQEGPGKSYFTNGNLEYEGSYKGNYFEGAGILYSEHEKGVKVYEGKFIKGRYHGTGYLDWKGEIYEGEFKNGKKHGDGVWKYKDPKLGLIFEGKFEAEEMIDGYARIRDANKTLLFEGEIRKGKYEGKATKYYKSGKKEYEGNFKAGFFDGFGVKYTESGEKEYEGEYIRGVITGDGKIYKNGIVIYDGRTLKGVYHGFGTLYDDDGNLVYKGPFNNGEFEGRGILYHPKTNQIKYEGDFIKSVFEGYGEKHSKKGYFKYAGGFRQGKFHGEGALYFPDGKTKKYVGTFNMKVFDGVGKLYTQDGKKIYEGDFLNGIYHGNGVLYYQEEKNLAYYEGEFENGLPHGIGTFRYEDGTLQYKGEVKNGAYHGKGTYYYTDGKVKANGSFINGKYNAP